MTETAEDPSPQHAVFRMVGLFAETFIHAGMGQEAAGIDLPVAREEPHGYPYIAGASFKGALRHLARRHWDPEPEAKDKPNREERVFGHTDHQAGDLLPSDVRLLLLPVRSLSSAFRYVTCPHLIRRFVADLHRARAPKDFPELSQRRKRGWAGAREPGPQFLEELHFVADELDLSEFAKTACMQVLANVIGHDELEAMVVVVSDDDFAWFARTALPVRARNRLSPETKTVEAGALWYEEYLPPDTVMYALLGERRPGGLAGFDELITAERNYLQVGGNETIGQGWFQVIQPERSTP